MAIFRQTENGMADVASVIGTPFLRDATKRAQKPRAGLPDPDSSTRARARPEDKVLWLGRNSKEPLSTPRLDHRSVADDLRDVAIQHREVAWSQLPVADNGAKIGESTLELERDQLTKVKDAGLSEVLVGIRSEALEVSDAGGVEVVVDLVEDLGSEAYVYTHAASGSGVEFVARCNPRTAPKLAVTARLRRHPEGRVHLFHPQTGESFN